MEMPQPIDGRQVVAGGGFVCCQNMCLECTPFAFLVPCAVRNHKAFPTKEDQAMGARLRTSDSFTSHDRRALVRWPSPMPRNHFYVLACSNNTFLCTNLSCLPVRSSFSPSTLTFGWAARRSAAGGRTCAGPSPSRCHRRASPEQSPEQPQPGLVLVWRIEMRPRRDTAHTPGHAKKGAF